MEFLKESHPYQPHMPLLSKLLGKQKEFEAHQWLENQGINIIFRNFNCKRGEIDLIGLSPDQTLIFFEVKYRKNDQFGTPQEMINTNQQKRIFQCADYFLSKHPQYLNSSIRFDGLFFFSNAKEPVWLKNAFGI